MLRSVRRAVSRRRSSDQLTFNTQTVDGNFGEDLFYSLDDIVVKLNYVLGITNVHNHGCIERAIAVRSNKRCDGKFDRKKQGQCGWIWWPHEEAQPREDAHQPDRNSIGAKRGAKDTIEAAAEYTAAFNDTIINTRKLFKSGDMTTRGVRKETQREPSWKSMEFPQTQHGTGTWIPSRFLSYSSRSRVLFQGLPTFVFTCRVLCVKSTLCIRPKIMLISCSITVAVTALGLDADIKRLMISPFTAGEFDSPPNVSPARRCLLLQSEWTPPALAPPAWCARPKWAQKKRTRQRSRRGDWPTTIAT
eukprot:1193918-Prorocentrum_minimum.AAC.8